MKRTLLAVGLAVLVSMMVVPLGIGGHEPVRDYGPFFLSHFIYDAVGAYPAEIVWGSFILQTIFLAILFAVIVNFLAILFAVIVNFRWRRTREK